MPSFPLVGIEEIGSTGPIIPVTIQHESAALAGFAARGLIDTGSSVVCISQRIADQLNLRWIDEDDDLGVVGGSVHANIYAASISIDVLHFKDIIRVYAVTMPRGSHDMLLGRSFLSKFLVTFDGPNGRFHFAHPKEVYEYEDLDG